MLPFLLEHAPRGYRHLVSRPWGSGDLPTPVPEAVWSTLASTGLPQAPEGWWAEGDEATAVLYVLSPPLIQGDSLRIVGGWMIPAGGAGGGAWGEEYGFRMVCREGGCRLTEEPDGGVWN